MPRRLLVTAALLGLAVILGAFLLATREGIEPPLWFAGEWHGRVVHPIGGEFDERLVFRVAGGEVSGSATYRGVRRVIEGVVVSADQVSFETRSHERVGSTIQTVVMQYVVSPEPDEGLRVELTRLGDNRHVAQLVFVAVRQ